jgi:hypothetical protein
MAYLTTINGKLRIDWAASTLILSESEKEPCCCCTAGCVITTITLIRPIVWPGVARCATGWLKYEDVSSHPANCRSNTEWRLINLPTCEIVASGKIENGKLTGLKDRACYPMPYWEGATPCPPPGPITFSSLLWLPLAFFAYAANFLDIETLIALLGSSMVALHCDGDLSCRYVLQLQTACKKDGELLWPEPNPCVRQLPNHGGGGIPRDGGGGDFPVP